MNARQTRIGNVNHNKGTEGTKRQFIDLFFCLLCILLDCSDSA
jgi:hypothetical protein